MADYTLRYKTGFFMVPVLLLCYGECVFAVVLVCRLQSWCLNAQCMNLGGNVKD